MKRQSAHTLAFAALLLAASVGGCEQAPPPGLVVLVESAPQSLDPRNVTDDIGTKISHLIFAPLVSFDTVDLEPSWVLAESMIQRSPTTFELSLRPALRFHDGSALGAEDVRSTFLSTPHAMKVLEDVQVIDERRLLFVLHRPHAPFLMTLDLGIVPRHEASRPLGSARVGAGPFRLQRWEEDGTVVLERFAHYVGGCPKLERLSFRPIRDDNTRILSLIGGSADLAVNNVSPIMLEVLAREQRLQVQASDSIKYSYLMFNMREPPLDDVRVRRAIAYAIDRTPIIEHKLKGFAREASGMLAPLHWAYQAELPRYTRDLQRARALLDDAGYTDPDGAGGQPRMRLNFLTSTSRLRRSIVETFAAQLAEVDIEVVVQSMEFGTFFAKLQAGQFGLASLQWPSPIDPDLMYAALHSSMIPERHPNKEGRNRGGYESPLFDALLQMGRTTYSREARQAFYRAAQVVLAYDLPYVPLWHEHNLVVSRRGLEDFTLTPNARLAGLAQASFYRSP